MILVFKANKIKTIEFTQEFVLMRRKPCANIKVNLITEYEKCILYLFHPADEVLTVFKLQ